VVSDWSNLKVNIVRNTILLKQSDDTAMCAMEPLNLFIEAEGYKIVYKWYQNSSLVQSGISNHLIFPNIVTFNSGIYKCKLEDACGTIYSENINLTVYPVTSISSISPDVIVPFGNDVILEVNADGRNLEYQWEKDGTYVINADNPQLMLQKVNTTDIGLYRTIVSGTCGSVISDPVYVYVRKGSGPDATEVFVWPTVASNEFNVAIRNNAPYNVQIYSMSGRLIGGKTNCRYQSSFDINTLPRGVYIVVVYNDSFRKSTKIIK